MIMDQSNTQLIGNSVRLHMQAQVVPISFLREKEKGKFGRVVSNGLVTDF